MLRSHTMIVRTLLLIVVVFIWSSVVCAQDKNEKYSATRYGLSIVNGKTYNLPNDINFNMVSGFALYDYDRVFRHKAPEELLFKVEASIGAAHYQKRRLVTSMNMFALYYLYIFKTGNLKPYVEGGIGIIYTDFKVRGQGLRLNFNPQIAVGTEIKTKNNNSFYLALRLHHISNGGLDEDNRGIDSVIGMFGFYF